MSKLEEQKALPRRNLFKPAEFIGMDLSSKSDVVSVSRVKRKAKKAKRK